MQLPPNPRPQVCCHQLLSFAERVCLERYAFFKFPPRTTTPELRAVLCQSAVCSEQSTSTSIRSDQFPKRQL